MVIGAQPEVADALKFATGSCPKAAVVATNIKVEKSVVSFVRVCLSFSVNGQV